MNDQKNLNFQVVNKELDNGTHEHYLFDSAGYGINVRKG